MISSNTVGFYSHVARCVEPLGSQLYPISDNTRSSACLELGLKWLTTCHREHTTCERPRSDLQTSWRPTRLIYIDPENLTLRLIEHEEVEIGIAYATLSHCWGTIDDKIVLTVGNLNCWKIALPSLQRMKTFTHAIEVAKRFSLSHIWIDSLCIIQDSREDWSQESSRMSDVYKYLYCNIAAAAAEDDTMGCFFSRDAESVFPLRFEFGVDAQVSQSVNHRRVVESVSSSMLFGQYDLHFGDTWYADIYDCALNRRA